MALKSIKPLVKSFDGRAVRPEPKRADPLYLSLEYRAWRETVIARAGRQCEAIDERTGRRCLKGEPDHRMFADHKIEVNDAPHLRFDPENGQCLCGRHHTLKTAAARAARLARPSG